MLRLSHKLRLLNRNIPAPLNDFPSSVGKICDVDLRDKFGRTPLMFAALADYPDCAEVLLREPIQ